MKRFFVLAIAVALTAALGNNNTWSHGSQGGGGGGGGGASGGASGAAGTAVLAAPRGAAGTAGASGRSGTGATTNANAANVGNAAANPAAVNQRGTAGTARTGAAGNVRAGVGTNATGVRTGANAQANLNSNFNGINQTPFFADPGVRTHLRLNNRQFNQLNSAYQQAYQRYLQRVAGNQTATARAGVAQQPRVASTAVPQSRVAQQRVEQRSTVRTGAAATQQPSLNSSAATTGTGNVNTGSGTTTVGTGTTTTGTGANVSGTSTTNAGVGTTAAGTTTTPTTIGVNPLTQQELARLQQLQDQFATDFNGSLDTTLTDPAMHLRFNQLNWQFQGLSAFNDPTVQQRLNLTADQRRQLSMLNAEWRRELANLRRGARNNLTQEQFNDLRTQFATRLNSVLTPEQQQLWAQLLGPMFNFPVTTFFPTTTTTTVGPIDVFEGTSTQPIAPQNTPIQSSQNPRTVR